MLIIKWTKKIVTILFIAFLLISLYITVSSKLTGRIPQIGGYQAVNVLTGSMNPTIQSGSIILIRNINDPNTVQVNDIITFQSVTNHNQLTTHRIVEMEMIEGELNFITKGDSNQVVDARKISMSNVLGKYQNFHIPYVGYIFQFSQTKIGFILFFVVPILLLVLSSSNGYRLKWIYTSKTSGEESRMYQ